MQDQLCKGIARYVDGVLIKQECIKCLQVTYPLHEVGIPECDLGGDFQMQKTKVGPETSTMSTKIYWNGCNPDNQPMNSKSGGGG